MKGGDGFSFIYAKLRLGMHVKRMYVFAYGISFILRRFFLSVRLGILEIPEQTCNYAYLGELLSGKYVIYCLDRL